MTKFRKDNMRIATWNIKSVNNKDQTLMKELSDNKIDICGKH